MPNGPALSPALDHLYQGQSNDCYWHGLFGGIYIVHMRMATLSHLIAAEDMADAAEAAAGGRPYAARLVDTDLDALDEVLVTTPDRRSWSTRLRARASHPGTCAPLGWLWRLSCGARPEAYHQRLAAQERKAEEMALAEAGGGAEATATASGGPKTIHDISQLQGAGPDSLPALRPQRAPEWTRPRAARGRRHNGGTADGGEIR